MKEASVETVWKPSDGDDCRTSHGGSQRWLASFRNSVLYKISCIGDERRNHQITRGEPL